MREIVAIGVVVLLALVGILPALGRLRRAIGFTHLLSSGHLFLVAGMLLGPAGIGLLDRRLLASLSPVLVFLLAWMGLIVGLRMELVLLKRVDRLGRQVTVVGAALPAAIVAAAIWLVAPGTGAAPILVAAACASGTAATAADWLMRGKRTRELALVSTVASLDDWVILGLALLGFAVAGGLGLAAPARALLALGEAGLVGAAVALLVPHLHQAGEELVVVIGGAALAGGLAGWLGLSAVAAGATAGLVVANTVRGRRGLQDVYQLVTRVERPLYLAFVVLAGALLDLARPELWVPLFAIVVAGRLVGKLLGGLFAARQSRGSLGAARAAMAMLPMSPLALAVVVDLALARPGVTTDALLTAVALAWLVFEILAALLARPVLGGGDG